MDGFAKGLATGGDQVGCGHGDGHDDDAGNKEEAQTHGEQDEGECPENGELSEVFAGEGEKAFAGGDCVLPLEDDIAKGSIHAKGDGIADGADQKAKRGGEYSDKGDADEFDAYGDELDDEAGDGKANAEGQVTFEEEDAVFFPDVFGGIDEFADGGGGDGTAGCGVECGLRWRIGILGDVILIHGGISQVMGEGSLCMYCTEIGAIP